MVELIVDKHDLMGSEEDDLLQMSGEMEGSSLDQESQLVEVQKEETPDIEMVDNRPKKLTGIDLIKENVKELHEVIAYMDYSFERAFTIQEQQFMLAYKVSLSSALFPKKILTLFSHSTTQKRFKTTSLG